MFRQMRQQLKHIKAKHQLQRTLWEDTSDKKLLTFYTKIMSKALGAERCSIFVNDPAQGSVWLQASDTLGEKAIEVPLSNTVVGRVIESGQAVIETDLEDKEGMHKTVDAKTGFTTRDILCVPIRSIDGSSITGALQVLNKLDGTTFTDSDRELLEELATYLQFQIESIFLNQETISVTESALDLATKLLITVFGGILLVILAIVIYNFALVGVSSVG